MNSWEDTLTELKSEDKSYIFKTKKERDNYG